MRAVILVLALLTACANGAALTDNAALDVVAHPIKNHYYYGDVHQYHKKNGVKTCYYYKGHKKVNVDCHVAGWGKKNYGADHHYRTAYKPKATVYVDPKKKSYVKKSYAKKPYVKKSYAKKPYVKKSYAKKSYVKKSYVKKSAAAYHYDYAAAKKQTPKAYAAAYVYDYPVYNKRKTTEAYMKCAGAPYHDYVHYAPCHDGYVCAKKSTYAYGEWGSYCIPDGYYGPAPKTVVYPTKKLVKPVVKKPVIVAVFEDAEADSAASDEPEM